MATNSLLTALLLIAPDALGATPELQKPIWFYLGHRIVADIAMMRLTPHAADAVRDILEGQSLADASAWADRIRSQRRDTSPLHFVNIPIAASTYVPDRDCPGGQCIIAAIERFTQVVGDSTASRLQRAEALRFVAHLVADLHQPLHVADNADKGGNRTQVRFHGIGTNLHKVWDGELMESVEVDESKYVTRLRARMVSLQLAPFERGTVVEWALEGHGIARDVAYQLPVNRTLDIAYVNASLPQVDLALIKAGVRLAKVLNGALADYRTAEKDQGPLPKGVYTDGEAAAHLGEIATVIGTVTSVRTSRAGNTFLNFGADYPHQTFSAVVLRPQHPGLQGLDSLRGRRVGVRGLIKLYKGQVEIVVQKPEQIVPVP